MARAFTWPFSLWRGHWPLWLLAGALTLAWLLLYRMDAEMRAMAAMAMAMPASGQWVGADWAFVFGAWALMMVAMMVPASWPLLMLLRRYGAHTLLPLLLGYLSIWTLFSATATAAQWGFSQQAFVQSGWYDPLQQRLHGGIGATLLLAAALYQLSPAKHSCLRHCQSPFTLLMTRWRAGFAGTLKLGLYHGLFCLGCCWLLMLVLFALGATNVFWAAALALATTAERRFPPPWPGRFITGGLLIGALCLLAF